MFQRLLHVLYTIEFFIVLIAAYSMWGAVGGSHFDLAAWYWKVALPLPAAFAVVRLTMALAAGGQRPIVLWGVLLAVLVVGAGLVTYYYHVNEPAEDEQQDPGSITPAATRSEQDSSILCCRLRRLDRRQKTIAYPTSC